MYQFDLNDLEVRECLLKVSDRLSSVSLSEFFLSLCDDFEEPYSYADCFVALLDVYEAGSEHPSFKGFVTSLYYAFNCMGLEVYF